MRGWGCGPDPPEMREGGRNTCRVKSQRWGITDSEYRDIHGIQLPFSGGVLGIDPLGPGGEGGAVVSTNTKSKDRRRPDVS